MSLKDKAVTLSDADISSERSVSRRSVLGTIGIGVGVAAASVFGAATPAIAGDPEGRGRRCRYRDGDTVRGTRGRPWDTVRQRCGRSDND